MPWNTHNSNGNSNRQYACHLSRAVRYKPVQSCTADTPVAGLAGGLFQAGNSAAAAPLPQPVHPPCQPCLHTIPQLGQDAEKGGKDYTFWRQLFEKPSTILGCR